MTLRPIPIAAILASTQVAFAAELAIEEIVVTASRIGSAPWRAPWMGHPPTADGG